MFKVLEGRKRRVFTPSTIVASIAAHLLLVGGAVFAAASAPGPEERVVVIDSLPPLPVEPPAPRPVDPTPPPTPPTPPSQPDAPAPVPGTRVDLETPTVAPKSIAPEPPGTPPVDPRDFGDGVTGDTIGMPPGIPTPPAGRIDPAPARTYVPRAEDVEEQPVLNRDGLSRTMERYYPSVLRDSHVAGRVVVELVVDENGRVRPGSARVVDASHPAFGEAALRAVERFRFRPAKMAGVPVPVLVTIPINWTVPD